MAAFSCSSDLEFVIAPLHRLTGICVCDAHMYTGYICDCDG